MLVFCLSAVFFPPPRIGTQPAGQHMPNEQQQQQQQQRERSAEPNRLYALLAPLVTETDKEVQNVAATQAELDKAVAHFTQRITFSRSSAGGWLPHHMRPLSCGCEKPRARSSPRLFCCRPAPPSSPRTHRTQHTLLCRAC